MRRMYSKKELENFLDENVVQSLEGKDVSVKTLSEEFDTELIDISEYLRSEVVKSGTLYAKLEVKHNLLFIVVSGNYVAGSAAGTNPVFTTNFIDAIPENIRGKIYRANGTALNENASGEYTISIAPIAKKVGTTIGGGQCEIRSEGKDTITLKGYSFGTIAEDTACFVDMRFILTL